ncbi:cytochrome C oxidase copper chaperone [Gonapodya prolifera JEL478]|uniref:Cytochrome C oxidase copper chaperone n=1 Tax=Gonapodya prolifera (strain JEL478) TaxID=1344416 RepID=A0A139ANV7_GONPJ|nr:cytochrome C oxidase copper chaperone [Gonapodya prolifera JEL478]|eukprot:KXS18430.1 cytochrome C oxidase copper chaperone [Gonapodya prolifera JEL478]
MSFFGRSSTSTTQSSSPALLAPSSLPPPKPTDTPAEPKCKPCCACPDTRQARDDCMIMYGEDGETKCAQLIKAHQQCMRDMGFNI